MNKALYNYAIRLLARRRYHSAELRKKLEKRSMRITASSAESDEAVTISPPSTINLIIDKLKGYGYLNDDEYIQLFIEDQLRKKPQGPRLIRQKLLRKGVDATQIAIHLSKANINQSNLAKKAAAKKIQNMEISDPRDKAKLMHFLHNRGFDFAAIKEVIKSAQS